ncbi:MAG: hydrogenase 4 subunit B, partial [Magnetospirillum sp.]|nr:hydrogenase 4 subunit B [Magnetospirillum sp.]
MLIAGALLTLPLLALFAIVAGRRDFSHAVVYAGCFVASAALLAGGLQYLGGHAGAPSAVLPLGLPWIKAHFRVDNLTALFLLIVNFSAAAASAFAVGYGGHLPQRRRVTPFYPVFLLAMNLVLLADDAFTFLVAWECMSLASWLMVVSDHKDAENRRAGTVYVIMAVFGTFCLLPCFGLLAGPGGDYTFAAMRLRDLGTLGGFLVALLAILGTGSKAGLVPLHAWLPLAHPAAPSHVSALMSGVMTKVALYGMIRILLDLHGDLSWHWGATLMVAGGITAVLGVLYAVMQDDLKKLLAYSTVENIGVAVIGLGLAIAFKGDG